MEARRLLLAAATLAACGCAHADLPCGGWVEQGDSLELHGPRGHLVLRAAPEMLAALRDTLLFRCTNADPAAVRPPLDIGPLEIDAVLQPPPETADGVVELRLKMRAQRLLMQIR